MAVYFISYTIIVIILLSVLIAGLLLPQRNVIITSDWNFLENTLAVERMPMSPNCDPEKIELIHGPLDGKTLWIDPNERTVHAAKKDYFYIYCRIDEESKFAYAGWERKESEWNADTSK